MLSSYHRLPGFHSEFVGLEVMGGHMDQIGFEDILNGERIPSAPCSSLSPSFFSRSAQFSHGATPSYALARLICQFGWCCMSRKKHKRKFTHSQ